MVHYDQQNHLHHSPVQTFVGIMMDHHPSHGPPHHPHQKIHSHRPRHSPHDSTPTHHPPHSPHYPYHTPYLSSSGRHPCPHCHSPPTSFHYDTKGGDLICTHCGAVLDAGLRESRPEWRDYSKDDGDGGGGQTRCGLIPVDENRWLGGLEPSGLSRVGFVRRGERSDGDVTMRCQHLRRTMALIERRVEKEQRERFQEAIWEGQLRDKLGDNRHQENVVGHDNIDQESHSCLPVTARGDFEAIIMKKQQQLQDLQLHSMHNNKWSLEDAILFYGTLEQVVEYVPLHIGDFNKYTNTNASISSQDEQEQWTIGSMENARTHLLKNRDSPTRFSALKLYTSFALLSNGAQRLDLRGGSSAAVAIFNQALGWLMDYVRKRDGFKVKGIPTANISETSEDKCSGNKIYLSLLPSYPELISSFTSSSKNTVSSLNADFHRIRQSASLCAAILYLSAKRNGRGRSLGEVCLAFGTVSMQSSQTNHHDSVSLENAMAQSEPLVQPKYCSKAMQELKIVLPHLVLITPASNEAVEMERKMDLQKSTNKILSSSELIQEKDDMSPTSINQFIPIKTEPKSPPYMAELTTSTFVSPTSIASSLTGKNHPSNQMSCSTTFVYNSEEEALADLTSRMARSLDLPQSATMAAMSVAVQCFRDARANAKHGGSKSSSAPSLFEQRNKRNGKKSSNSRGQIFSTQKEESSDVVAVASVLLISIAGEIMQKLARQALHSQDLSSNKGLIQCLESERLSEITENLSNPMDELQEEFSSPPGQPCTGGASNSSDVCAKTMPHPKTSNSIQLEARSSWLAWDCQPKWHCELSRIEKCTGVHRKSIVSYYSSVLHPRRSYFLGVVKNMFELGNCALEAREQKTGCKRKRNEAIHEDHDLKKMDNSTNYLLRNIVTAVPLMTLRGLND